MGLHIALALDNREHLCFYRWTAFVNAALGPLYSLFARIYSLALLRHEYRVRQPNTAFRLLMARSSLNRAACNRDQLEGSSSRGSGATISYDLVQNFPGWQLASEYLTSRITRHGCKRVLEIGAGPNPTFSPQQVQSAELSYVISDSSEDELTKTSSAFERLVLDLSSKPANPALNDTFDCVFSRMVGEHISNGERYHSNIFKILRRGGVSIHCFSTMWALPFVANRFLPDNLGGVLQNFFSHREERLHGKFKAYYSWSRGPTTSMLRRFQRIGFKVLEYTGYFGHFYYLRLPWLHRAELWKSRLLLQRPIPQLCSYAALVLRKPEYIDRAGP